MCHHVKTTAGITEDYYSHTTEIPKFGEGQGKASSPPNWLFLSSTLLAALHALCSSVFLLSISKRFTSKRVAESYVDDTDAIT
eukprot:13116311-Ditylum_brightwellii.AAC.1